MAIFGQYTGQRVSPLPSGFMGAAMTNAANIQRGLSEAGDTIGAALEKYGKRKEESEMLDGLIQGQAQRALETNQFLGEGQEVAGVIGPDGKAVTGNIEKQTLTGALPDTPRATERNVSEEMLSSFGIRKASPLSQKTNLLYEIAGDQKLVDKFLSGDATLAQKKGLLANLQMYNTKLDDYAKRASIEEHRFKVAQREAYNRSYGAGQDVPDRIVTPARTETETTTNEIASKSNLDALLHRQETGQTLTPEQFDKLEGYFAAGGSYRPQTVSQPASQNQGNTPASPGAKPKAGAAPSANLPDFSAYSRDLKQERATLKASEGVAAELEAGMYQTTSEKARIDRLLRIARNTPGKKVDSKLVEQSRALGDQVKAYDKSLKSVRDDIKGREQYLSYMDKEANKFAEQVKGAVSSELPKIAQLGLPKYLAGQLTPKIKTAITESTSDTVIRPGIPPMPDSGYVDGPWTETTTTTRDIPAVTEPASIADRKAARIKAFIEEGGTMTPQVVAQFDKEYPEASIVSQPVPGVAGATALFDNKGRFLQVVTPPTLSASDRAAVAAITFTPNTGFTGVAPSKEEAVKFRELVATSNEVTVMMNQLMDMAKEGKAKWFGPKKAQAKALIATLVGKMRIPLTGGGPLTEEERKYIQENLFTDPYDWATWAETSESQIKTVMDMMSNSVNRKAEVLGLQPVGQTTTGSSAPKFRSFDTTGNEVK